MRGKELVKLLHKKGWHVDRVQGSHYVMKMAKELK
ncbi:MAG: type II toxin-antitoxin system HicA family toxin [Anaerovoracaceae bacterium]